MLRSIRLPNCIGSLGFMAEETSLGDSAPRKPKSNAPIMVMGALVALSLAAAGWFWHRSTEAQANQVDDDRVRSVLHLESFVVNLSGATDNAYMRVGIDLGLGIEQKEGEKQTAFNGRLRDTILSVLGTQSVEALLTTQGKAKLREDLLKAIVERVPEIHCREIYFTEFLVQH